MADGTVEFGMFDVMRILRGGLHLRPSWGRIPSLPSRCTRKGSLEIRVIDRIQ